ncbi:MAG: choice-of-anchor tandem repeat GloVer-containing protein [Terriglobales bacterium]
MRTKAIVVLTLLLFSIPSSGQAGTEKVLYAFTGGLDGGQPMAGVIFDPAGNLYGVTQYGGAYNQGTVFELTPSPGGTWTETVLYSFGGVPDGSEPQYNLVMDGAGNLYGATSLGGPGECNGTVFELSPSESGWTFTLLYAFNGGNNDGCVPSSDLFLRNGYLYGTTGDGGPANAGTIFVVPTSGGRDAVWTFNGTNGDAPSGLGLINIRGSTGIYGTTIAGGDAGGGVVFEAVDNQGRAGIRDKYQFKTTKGKAGWSPYGDLATQVNPDGLGIMYGTTSLCANGCQGTVYQLTQDPEHYPPYDKWALSVLHSFSGLDGDGASPFAGVVLDAAGNLYGTTAYGGASAGYAGTVFKLTPGASNQWTETVLYSFSGGTDGSVPYATVVLDSTGNLYGTTYEGGAYGQGVVYEVTPPAAKATTLTTLTSSPNPSVHYQAVTFTAVVTSSAGPPPDGETVTFVKTKTVLGTGSLSSGSATLTISTLPVGSFKITAVYGGDSNFAGSTSNVVQQVVEKAGN